MGSGVRRNDESRHKILLLALERCALPFDFACRAWLRIGRNKSLGNTGITNAHVRYRRTTQA
jgi:hypothetical protein